MRMQDYLFSPDLDQIGRDDLIRPSTDIQLGRWFVSFRRHAVPQASIGDEEIIIHSEEFFKRHYVEFGSSLRLNPNQIIFAVSLQWLQIPQQANAILSPDDSRQSTGLWVNISQSSLQGFNGCLTIELFNSSSTAIELRPGDHVGKLSVVPFTDNTVDEEPRSNGISMNRRRPQLDPVHCRRLMQNDFRKL